MYYLSASVAFSRAMICLLSFLTVFGISVADDNYLGPEDGSKTSIHSSTTEGAATKAQGNSLAGNLRKSISLNSSSASDSFPVLGKLVFPDVEVSSTTTSAGSSRGWRDNAIRFPVMLTTSASYLKTKHKLYGKFSIYFKMKTTHSSGLLLFGGFSSFSRDFLAVEVFGGRLRYVFDVGSGIRVVVSPSHSRPVSDNRWHEVTISRPSVTQHTVSVDGVDSFDHLPDTRSVHYDLVADDLYVGGLPRHLFSAGAGGLPAQVMSRHGFQGCLASLTLDGVSWKMAESRVEIPEEHKTSIKEGCVGPTDECSSSSCSNGGICVQQWNSYACDCDMTSFTGPKCNDDGVSFHFGSLGGVIVVTFSDRENRKSDRLAFGFVTSNHHGNRPFSRQQRIATLLRVKSESSNDFIEVQMIDGVISVVYNMGKVAHRISSAANRRLDDGRYHVIRFVRNGQNSSLQVDESPATRKNPSGKQLTTFNQPTAVYLAASKDETGALVRQFHGIIAGVVLNGHWTLEMAANGDSMASIEGDVELNVTPLKSYLGRAADLSSSATTDPPTPKGIVSLKMGHRMAADDVISPSFAQRNYSDGKRERATLSSSRDSSEGNDVTGTTRRFPTMVTKTVTSSCFHDDEDCFAQRMLASGDEASVTSDPEHRPIRTQVKYRWSTSRDPLAGSTTVSPAPPSTGAGGGGGAADAISISASNRISAAAAAAAAKSSSSVSKNLVLIVGVASGVVVLVLVLCYVIYRVKGYEGGSYKLDGADSSCDAGGICALKTRSESGNSCRASKTSVREWYV